MKKSYHIAVPCSEDWNGMDPVEQGRHCEKCAMTVIDFTQMTEAEIIQTLEARSGQRTCGRMRKEVPSYTLPEIKIIGYQQAGKFQISNSLYLLSIAALLLSACGNNEEILGKVINQPQFEIQDTLVSMPYTKDSIQAPQSALDTLNIQVPNEPVGQGLPTKSDPFPEYSMGKVVMPDRDTIKLTGEVLEIQEPIKENVSEIKKHEILGAITYDMPTFPGGNDSMLKFIRTNLIYPEYEKSKSIQGRVVATFTIDSTGKLRDIKIIKSIPEAPNFDAEVLRILQLMPDWVPARYPGGMAESVKYTLPIRFVLQN